MRGSCQCGAVAFRSNADWHDPISCHCNECRKLSGHFFAAAPVPADSLVFEAKTGLRWFDSSDFARRGFCAVCGSSLFYEYLGSGRIFVAGGAVKGPTNTHLTRQMWVEEKGDYYDLDTDLQPDTGFGADGPEALK